MSVKALQSVDLVNMSRCPTGHHTSIYLVIFLVILPIPPG